MKKAPKALQVLANTKAKAKEVEGKLKEADERTDGLRRAEATQLSVFSFNQQLSCIGLVRTAILLLATKKYFVGVLVLEDFFLLDFSLDFGETDMEEYDTCQARLGFFWPFLL